MTSSQVLCYGEIGVDNVIQVDRLPTPEIAVFPTGDSYHIGGAAANTGVWLAHLGLPVALAGNAIGDDLYGGWLWEWLNAHPHLDLSLVERRPGVSTPFTRVMVTPDAERSFLIYGYPQAPKTPLTPAILAGVRYLALDLYGGPERLEAARTAHAAGVTTAIGDVIDPDHPALPLTGIATNSGHFIRATYPGVNVRQHAHRLQSISHGIVITTGGAEAIHAIDRTGSSFTVQPPPVVPVDATGAGDAFRAGLLYSVLQGWELPRAVCWGAACGALKVRHLGAATTLPSFDQVRSLAATLEALPAG